MRARHGEGVRKTANKGNARTPNAQARMDAHGRPWEMGDGVTIWRGECKFVTRTN